jgi:hypothetical protein
LALTTRTSRPSSRGPTAQLQDELQALLRREAGELLTGVGRFALRDVVEEHVLGFRFQLRLGGREPGWIGSIEQAEERHLPAVRA